MRTTKIEWTESTWNPITGCTKISPGCANCYAERMAIRLKAMGQSNYANGFELTWHQDAFDLPLRWKKSRVIFVNSMSDLFHEQVPECVVFELLDIMRCAHWHVFQVLTKRSQRLIELSNKIIWPPNVWVGVSIENGAYTFRADDLRKTGAAVKFLSCEPLIGPLNNLDLQGINWVIVGGESGIGAREVKKEWVVDIRDTCSEYNVPFFFKQWGGVNKKRTGRLLDDQTWDELPTVAHKQSLFNSR